MGSAAFHTELNSLCELDGEKSSHGPPSLSQELRGIDAANGISPKKKKQQGKGAEAVRLEFAWAVEEADRLPA